MEPEFIAELDRTLTNVGTDVFWKRKIGKLEIWLSPLSVEGQEKVTATLEKATPGLNIVGESKKITLSNTIVGVNGLDFRDHRGTNQPVFPIKGRDGKLTNVALEKYLYEKMRGWSTDYLDSVFEVYADLMETFQRENLKEVKFENTKDPRIELIELERKAAALRAQLGLPQMVEKTGENAAEQDGIEPTPEDIARALEEEERLQDEGTEENRTKGKQEDFNPFKPLSPEQQAAAPPSMQAAPVHQGPQPGGPRQPPPPSPPPQSTMGMPAALPANLRRPMPPGQGPRESSPENPHVASPSVQNEVIERPAVREPPVRPKVDQPQGNTNPRFSQQRR
jgi:hypothetical protein